MCVRVCVCVCVCACVRVCVYVCMCVCIPHLQYIFSRHVLALFTKTPRQGAQTSIHCAVASEAEGITGKYWSDCALKGPSRTALDNEACRKL